MSSTNSAMNTVIGILSVFVGHVIVSVLMFAIAFITNQLAPRFDEMFVVLLVAFLGIGLTQLLYVIPLVLWTNSKHRFDTMKGVIIGAVITLLLNGSCFVVVYRYVWLLLLGL